MELIISDIDDAKKLMNLALYAGSLLVSNGAESYRAEDTVERICMSCQEIDSVDCYALPTAIFLKLKYKDEFINNFKKIKVSDINLGKIDLINNFSRNFSKNIYDLDKAYEELKSIENKGDRQYQKIIAGGIAASFFTVLFGGSLKDFFPSFIIGMIISYFVDYLYRFKMSFFINNAIASLVSAVLAISAVKLGLGNDFDKIIIGVIMLIVPGVAITNALRDIMSGEFITGAITLIKAVFIALAIAIGAGFGLKFMRMMLWDLLSSFYLQPLPL